MRQLKCSIVWQSACQCLVPSWTPLACKHFLNSEPLLPLRNISEQWTTLDCKQWTLFLWNISEQWTSLANSRPLQRPVQLECSIAIKTSWCLWCRHQPEDLHQKINSWCSSNSFFFIWCNLVESGAWWCCAAMLCTCTCTWTDASFWLKESRQFLDPDDWTGSQNNWASK